MIARWVASSSICQARAMPWKYGVGLALVVELLGEHVDRRAVLGVHHRHQPEVGGLLHRLEDLRVVGVEDPG